MNDGARRRFWGGIARLIVAAGLLAVLVAFVDVRAIVATAGEAYSPFILAALTLLPLNLLLDAAKWRLLVSRACEPVSFREALGSVFAGIALGFVTPARVGEYAGRVFYLKNGRKGLLLVLSAIDRMYSVWIYFLVGTVILGFGLQGTIPGPGGIWWLTVAAGAATTIVLGWLLAQPARLSAIGPALARWTRRDWTRHLDSLTAIDLPTVASAVALSALRYTVFCAQFVLLVLAFFPAAPALPLFAAVSLVFFAKTLIPSISAFDLGIRESAAVFFLGFYGVTAPAALNASLTLFAINLLVPAVVGILVIPRMKWTRFAVAARRSMTAEASQG